jgi:hypothetical protein
MRPTAEPTVRTLRLCSAVATSGDDMTLWRLTDDANGATVCDACDVATCPMMTAEDLADWLQYRGPVLGHCEYCGTADHGTDLATAACSACEYLTCPRCGHWSADHDDDNGRLCDVACAICASGN